MLEFLQSLPSPIAQGMIWGIMAIGVYITYKILDLADLTVDGSFGTGGAVLVVLTTGGMNIYLAMLIAFLAGCLAGLVTGILHTKFGNSCNSCRNFDTACFVFGQSQNYERKSQYAD